MIGIVIFSSIICLPYFFIGRFNQSIGKVKFKFIDAFLTLLLAISVLILMTANRLGYDVLNYTRFFLHVKNTHINPFDYTYEFLSRVVIFVSSLFTDITYPKFQALLLTILGSFLIFPILKKYSVSTAGVISLYILSGSYAIDGMQFKNFIAVSFLLFAIYVLLNGGRMSLPLYYIVLMIAILFHFSFTIYLFLPLIRTHYIKNSSTIFPIIGMMTYLFFFFMSPVASALLMILSRLPFLSKLAIYATQSASYRSLVAVGIYLMVLFLLEYCRRYQEFLTNKTKYLLTSILLVWRMLGLVVPFLYFANAPFRLYRNLFILIFIVIVNTILELPVMSRARLKIIFSSLAVIGIIYYYPILLGQYIDVYYPVIDSGMYFWE